MLYVSLIHLTATDVSSPPLYASTTLSLATDALLSLSCWIESTDPSDEIVYSVRFAG